MTDADRIGLLKAALEEIRRATFQPMMPDGTQLPSTGNELKRGWALIQSIAARALREVEKPPPANPEI